MFPHDTPLVMVREQYGVLEHGPKCNLVSLARRRFGGLPAAVQPRRAIIEPDRVPIFLGREHPEIPWPNFSIGAGMVRLIRVMAMYWERRPYGGGVEWSLRTWFGMRLPCRETSREIDIEAGRMHSAYEVDHRNGGSWADLLQRELYDVVSHEIDESLRIDGDYVTDPHKDDDF